jgi:hypothetical protein
MRPPKLPPHINETAAIGGNHVDMIDTAIEKPDLLSSCRIDFAKLLFNVATEASNSFTRAKMYCPTTGACSYRESPDERLIFILWRWRSSLRDATGPCLRKYNRSLNSTDLKKPSSFDVGASLKMKSSE